MDPYLQDKLNEAELCILFKGGSARDSVSRVGEGPSGPPLEPPLAICVTGGRADKKFIDKKTWGWIRDFLA